MKSLKWEEIGTKNLFLHTSTWELLRWLALYNISPTRHDTRNYYQSGTAASYLLLCPRPRGGGILEQRDPTSDTSVCLSHGAAA